MPSSYNPCDNCQKFSFSQESSSICCIWSQRDLQETYMTVIREPKDLVNISVMTIDTIFEVRRTNELPQSKLGHNLMTHLLLWELLTWRFLPCVYHRQDLIDRQWEDISCSIVKLSINSQHLFIYLNPEYNQSHSNSKHDSSHLLAQLQ